MAKLICASNSNNVLTDFLKTGVYDRNRPFYATVSPSMDILISSNLERLLYDLSGRDDQKVRGYMESLAKTGRYEVDDAIKEKLGALFCAGFCDDRAIKETIGDTFQSQRVPVRHPHGGGAACLRAVCSGYRGQDPNGHRVHGQPLQVFVERPGRGGEGGRDGMDEFSKVAELSSCAKQEAPQALASLKDKAVRFKDVCTKDTMERVVLSMLGIS